MFELVNTSEPFLETWIQGRKGDTTCGSRDAERETEPEQARPTEETNRKSQYLFSADPNLYNNCIKF